MIHLAELTCESKRTNGNAEIFTGLAGMDIIRNQIVSSGNRKKDFAVDILFIELLMHG